MQKKKKHINTNVLLKEEKKSDNISDFQNAKTIEEAKEYADRFVQNGKSRFDNAITLENLNQFNEQMTHLTEKYNYNEFYNIGYYKAINFIGPYKVYTSSPDSIAHASMKTIEIETRYGAISKRKIKNMFKREITNYGEDERCCIKSCIHWSIICCDLIKKNSNDKKLIKENLKEIKNFSNAIKRYREKLKYTRYDVHYSPESHIKDTVTHEFGHSIMYRAINREQETFGKNGGGDYILAENKTKTCEMIKKTFQKAKSTDDIYKISYYSNTDYQEFFAECFVIYEEKIEKLPDYINDMVEFVLKI